MTLVNRKLGNSKGAIQTGLGFWDRKTMIENLGVKRFFSIQEVLQDPGKVVENLRSGGIAVVPTDTLYGLAARVLDPMAIERLYRLKGRSFAKEVPVLIENPEKMLPQLVSDIPKAAQELIEKFWPAPLTLILRAKKNLPRGITGNSQTIGVRQSRHPVIRAIIQELGEPITGTSANLSGMASPFCLEQISPSLLEGVDQIVDGETLSGRKGSTVLDFTGKAVKIIRQGDLSLSRIQETIDL